MATVQSTLPEITPSLNRVSLLDILRQPIPISIIVLNQCSLMHHLLFVPMSSHQSLYVFFHCAHCLRVVGPDF